jgi:hypothetical protein
MKTLFSLLAFGFVVFSGCSFPPVAPDMTAFKDPAYFSRYFKTVVVFADTSDLRIRQGIEKNIAKELDERGVTATPAHLHLPPTRQWSDADRKKFFAANGVDAYLVVSVRDAGIREEYIPPQVVTTRTLKNDKTEETRDTTKKKEKLKTTEIEKEQIVTQTSGGYTEYYPWIEYDVKLFDAANDQTAWIGLRVVSTKYSSGLNSFYDLVADRLVFDRIVAVVEK